MLYPPPADHWREDYLSFTQLVRARPAGAVSTLNKHRAKIGAKRMWHLKHFSERARDPAKEMAV